MTENMERAIKELQKPLDPKHVKPAPQGKYGDYVDGHHVVSEANRIFGEFGWSYGVTRLDMVCRVEAQDRNGNPQIRIGYAATVKVEIWGESFKEGAAVGSGMARPENEADAHESAIKEAETDALKRALRTYGNTFGLALYDKTQANVRAPEVERDPRTLADSLIALIARQSDIGKLEQVNRGEKFEAALDWLAIEAPDMATEVKAAYSERFNKLDSADYEKDQVG